MSLTIKLPENVYRYPYEFVGVAAYSAAAFAAVSLPMPGMAQLIAIPAFAGLAGLRAKGGLRIRKYRKNIRNLPYYALTPDQIPVSDKALFIGKGFRWTQTHTQRLMMVRQPENDHLRNPSRLYKAARNHEIVTQGETWLTRLTSNPGWWNPVAPLPPVGGSPEIHGVEPDEEDIYTPLGERVGHAGVFGTTRVGKTRLAEVLINQDIQRGDVVITFDPKGDADLMLSMYTQAMKAGRPFYMFHLGFPEISCRYNPIADYSRITEVATRIANQLPSDGQSAAFRDFVWRYVNVLAKIMEALSIKPSYNNIYRCAVNIDDLAKQYFEQVLNIDHAGWEREFDAFELDSDQKKIIGKTGRDAGAVKMAFFMKSKDVQEPLTDAVTGILGNDRTYFEKLISSLYPLLEKLTSGKVAELLSPNLEDLEDERPLMDWRKVMASNAVVYIGLDSLTDREVAGAVGNAMFADLTSLSGQIYKHGQGYGQSGQTAKRKVSIHADEFNELIGDEFIPLLNKAGGAGYQVTVYTQTGQDVEARIGSTAKAEQIFGNLNTIYMMRVRNVVTAEMLTKQLPDVTVISGTLISGAGDVAFPDDMEDFTSRNEDRLAPETVPMLSTADLLQLPKGQAFALLEGGQLYKIRLPLPLPDNSIDIPKNITEAAHKMREIVRLNQMKEENEAFVEGCYYG